MTRADPYPAGTPCWVDIAVPDVSVASSFYASVIGWDVTTPDPRFGGYATAQVGENDAAGLAALQVPGMATAWTLYFASDDVELTASSIREHGGSVLLDVSKVGDLGRLCIAADPTGAVFGVWECGTYPGGAAGELGCMAWFDLRSPAPSVARAFYTQVFGFTHTPAAGAPETYQTFSRAEGRALGGIGGAVPEEGSHPHWVIYFSVARAAEAVDAATAAGGRLVVEDFDTPFGQMAGLVDPFGAIFWVVQLPPGQR